MMCNNESRKALFTVEEIVVLAKKIFPSPNLKIIDFHLQPYSKDKLGYLGIYELLTIEVLDGTIKKTLTFFVKTLAPAGNVFHRMVQLEESAFYREAVPCLLKNYKIKDPWAAKCYLARSDVLVLENLKSIGFQVTSKPLEENQLKSLVASVARFHVSSMLVEMRLRKPLNKEFERYFKEKIFVNDGGLKWKWLLTGIEVAEAVACKLNLEPKYIQNAYELEIERKIPVKGQRNVLGHCDLWCNNMMFSKDGTKCRLIDFQMVTYVHYAVELIQLIYLNTTRYSRLELEKKMIEYYYAILEECFKVNDVNDDKLISLDEIFKDVEEKRICGLITALQYFPIALLNKELAKEYTKDTNTLEEYMYASRKDFVLKAMTLDSHYRSMIENMVEDTIEFMQKH